MAIEHDADEDGSRSEPRSEFHALARKVMDEDRDVLDALDE